MLDVMALSAQTSSHPLAGKIILMLLVKLTQSSVFYAKKLNQRQNSDVLIRFCEFVEANKLSSIFKPYHYYKMKTDLTFRRPMFSVTKLHRHE
jgi:hypothetical protein